MVCGEDRSSCRVSLWVCNKPPFAASMGLETAFTLTDETFRLSIPIFDAPSKPTVTFVNLDSSHHHRPLSMKSYLQAGDEGHDGPLPSFEGLLGSAGGAQNPQYAVSRVKCGRRRADGGAEHLILVDWDDVPTPGANGGGDNREETGSRSSVGSNSGGSLSEEQCGEQRSLSTAPTSLTSGPDSEAGYDNPRSLISLLTKACNPGLPRFTRR